MADALETAKRDDLWAVWRRLVKALPVAGMPLEWIFSPSIWSLFGVDFLSGLLKNRTTRKAFAVLEPLSQRDLRRVHALALLNQRRHDVISRWTAIALLTVPASAALTLSELSPQTLRAVAALEGAARWYLMLGYAAGVVAMYLLFAWRARQLVVLVEMWLIHRGVDLREPAEPEAVEPIVSP